MRFAANCPVWLLATAAVTLWSLWLMEARCCILKMFPHGGLPEHRPPPVCRNGPTSLQATSFVESLRANLSLFQAPGVNVSPDVLATFVEMAAPVLRSDRVHTGENWPRGFAPPVARNDKGKQPASSSHRFPFRVGVFGGSVSTRGWTRKLQNHLDILQTPAIVESNAIGATGTGFWLLCPPARRYDVLVGEWSLNELSARNLHEWIAQAARISRYICFLDVFGFGLDQPNQIDAPNVYKRVSLDYMLANPGSSGFVAFRDAAAMWWRWMSPFTTRLLFSAVPEECHAAAEAVGLAGKRDVEAIISTCMKRHADSLKHGTELYQELVALSVSWAVANVLLTMKATPWSSQKPEHEHTAMCVGSYGMKYVPGMPTILPQSDLTTLNFTKISGFQYGDVMGAPRPTKKLSMYATAPGAVLELRLPSCARAVTIMYVGHTWGPDGSTFEMRVQNKSRTHHTDVYGRSKAEPPKVRFPKLSHRLDVTPGSNAFLTVTTLDVPKGNFVEICRVILAGC
ncbi:unnamed protein product [Effrenium voratum]|uniref:Uncharacterized protein n=1 Tax=Effrenium voratum TaxID=2562239 RepID=A0AA36MVC3_9DINO|nr:unnamed protein product [Effrenium voratum]CAJ1437797.1 unnamed protein product [Effrenium voratum]